MCALQAVRVHGEQDIAINFSCVARLGDITCPAPSWPDPYWWEVAAGTQAALAAGLALVALLLVRASRLRVRLGVFATGSMLGYTLLALSSKWLMTNDSAWAWAAASLVLGMGLVLLVETRRLLLELRSRRLNTVPAG